MAGVVPVPDQLHLPKGVEVLKCQVRGNMEGQEQTVYLVGTAHVSTSSASDARAVIRAVRPQVSVVPSTGLCPQARVPVLLPSI